jgi:hypothetical protein
VIGTKVGESFLQVTDQLRSHSRLDDDVVDVDLQVVADLLLETSLHALLEGGILEAEWHGSVAKSAEGGDEGHGQLIGGVHCDLMVPKMRVQNAKGLIAGDGVNDLVNPRKGEWVFGAGLIEAGVVHIHSPFPILLLDQDGVGRLIGVLDLSDEAGVEELGELHTNCLELLLVKAVEALLHWLGVSLDVEVVLGNLLGDARCVRGLPREDIGVVMQELCEG